MRNMMILRLLYIIADSPEVREKEALDYRGIQYTTHLLRLLNLNNCNVPAIKCKSSFSVIPLDGLAVY
jgi:hypothetical protein